MRRQVKLKAHMRKIIWTCWFQGVNRAPRLVRQCVRSLEVMNPGWELRVLDAGDFRSFVPIGDYLDLRRQRLKPAALADVVRISLLQQFGGVWADATVLCRQPLDAWLPELVRPSGFFAFDRPAPDRPLASWLLAAQPGNLLATKWAMRVADYWRGRRKADAYYWFHREFDRLCDSDPEAAEAWRVTPRISADGPHSVQTCGGMLSRDPDKAAGVDWGAPVFKLDRRIPGWKIRRDCLLDRLLGEVDGGPAPPPYPGTAA